MSHMIRMNDIGLKWLCLMVMFGRFRRTECGGRKQCVFESTVCDPRDKTADILSI